LTIEHPFGIVPGKEVPVTKHDAARKQKIVDFIAATVRQRGYPPTVREIAAAVDLASTSAVHHHLEALEREGVIERGGSHSRAITLTSQTALRAGLIGYAGSAVVPFNGRNLPVIGEIAAGGPIEAYQDSNETLAVPEAVAANGDAYVLRVRGDSMIDAHITDGDYVVIRPQQTAHDGDIVVAQVEENAVTLKRFFKEKDRVRLQPANDLYPPQFYDTVRIQGKLIGVIRRVD
jgi:repressor LexA